MQVSKWGNSLAIRLPAVVVEALELKEGDEVDITVAGERGFDVARLSTRQEWLERLRAFQATVLFVLFPLATWSCTKNWAEALFRTVPCR